MVPALITLFAHHPGGDESTERIQVESIPEAASELARLLAAGWEYVSVTEDANLALYRTPLSSMLGTSVPSSQTVL